MQRQVTATTKERTPKRPGLLVRLSPSLTDVALLMPLVFVFLKLDGAKTLLGDGDTGWHIRTGDWILANARVPTQDMFSFTRAGEPWFAWEWLADVIMAGLHSVGGLPAVVFVALITISLTTAGLYRLTRRRCDNVLIAIGVVLLATMAMSIHWLARPHLATLLFVVVFYAILERAREGNLKLLAFTPLLTILWVNIHGGFFIGCVLIGCYGAGEALEALLTRGENWVAALKRVKPYASALAGCAAASLVNPYGYALHRHILTYLSEPYHRDHINEFQSLSFHSPAGAYFEALLILAAGALFWNLMRGRYTYVLLIAGWAHLALYAGRNIPIFAIVMAPLAAEALNEAVGHLRRTATAAWVRSSIEEFEDFARDIARTDLPARVHVASVGVYLFLGLLLLSPNAEGKARAEFDPARYPASALTALDSLGPGTRVFASDEWGDYLIYRRYPSLHVFVDGRSDFYGPEFGMRYLDTISVAYNWEANLDRNRVNAVLLSANASLAGTLKESERWQIVYDDGVAILFHDRRDDLSPASAYLAQVTSSTSVCRDYDEQTGPAGLKAPEATPSVFSESVVD